MTSHDVGLHLASVAVRRGGNVVLRDLDLDVSPTSLVTIVGPSGAGKTTLLRAIAGLEQLAAGRVTLDGSDLGGVPVHRRGMAAVFQEPRLFPNLDVAGNVAFPLRMQGVARAERRRRASELLDEVGLAGFGNRSVADLSGGEARRTALARALASTPRVLLLDEPLVGVEPARREGLRRLIRRLHDEHAMTTVHVTHDRAEAAELGDTIALVMEGRVWQHAAPRELFERPSSAIVARFFGATNLLSGDVASGALGLSGGWLPVSGPDGGATVVVRPERIRIDDEGSLSGRAREVTYQGTHLRVAVDAGPDVIVHAPVNLHVRVGDPVRLRVDADDVWRLPDPDVAADNQR